MDGKGTERWRMLRCAGVAEDKTVIERIMLRFRPIAPKPVNGDPVSGSLQAGSKNLVVTNTRSKRKYVRVRNRKRKINEATDDHHEKNGSFNEDGLKNKIVTLQLLPERAEFEDSTRRGSWCNNIAVSGKEKAIFDNQEQPMWLELKNKFFHDMGGFGGLDQTAVMPQRKVVESCVTVESVSNDTCMDARRLGSEDIEIMKNLERDTCPGFISDGLNKVKWVNGAYKRMVTEREENETSAPPTTVVVLLVMKEKFPWLFSSLTCRVRVEYYTWQKLKYSKMVPCDVWRMEWGGFAWRLDVESALSLGR